jgi:hypothetical protein
MQRYDSTTGMDVPNKINKILYYAYRCLNSNEMLARQCDGWLSAEEGNRNLMKAIEERERAKRRKSNPRLFKFFKMIRFKKNMCNLQNSKAK